MTQSPTATREPQKTRPLIWVKRLVLYQSIDPVQETRSVAFTTGLNVIQGSANESDEGFESGHGVGKTTVCRLLRYCLGEKSFGQKHVVEEVKHCFPTAHVGAVVEVGGTEWAVLRPLGSRGTECALEGVDLDGLIGAGGPKRYDAFVDRLASVVLAGVPVGETLTGDQRLQWLHVLAMCSRDQEARYDRFWNWRHTRSESGSPKFNKPKVDAGLCVRALVGLLDPAEPRLRVRLEQLEAKLETTRATLKERRAEPAFFIKQLRQTLAAEYGVRDAENAPLGQDHLFGLPRLTETRLAELRQEVAGVEAELAPLDRQISLAAASLLEPEEMAGQRQAASEVTGEGNDTLLADIEHLRSIRQLIRDAESSLCRWGRVLIGDCSYVQARTSRIEHELRNQQRSTLPTVSEREQAAARLAEQAERQRSIVGQIQQRLDAMNRQRNDLLERRRNLNEQIRRMPAVLNAIQDHAAVLEGTRPNTAIQALETDEANTVSEIEATKVALARLLAAQGERLRLFESRFDGAVKHTLTAEFKGVVRVEEDGVHFGIMRGEALSGEAYETLAVLLADVALLFESSAAHARHPGFLLHDSPREADLNVRIYRRLLEMADSEMRRVGQAGDVPFQYIITTTTEPSERLRGTPVTRLTLSDGPGSLFGRQLEAPLAAQPAPTLFDEERDT